jgi:hypothetical protein
MNIDSVVGYTGPRTGMESAQLTTVAAILIEWGPTEVHHGICVGGDEQFHKLVRSLFGRDIVIVGHPISKPNSSTGTATCSSPSCRLSRATRTSS